MPDITLAQIYSGLQTTDHRQWTGPTITFSIPGGDAFWSPISYPPGDEPSNPQYGVLTAAQAAGFRIAIAAWDQLIATNLVEVQDNAVSNGQIRIAFTDVNAFASPTTIAFAYEPPLAGNGAGAFNGDVWLDERLKEYTFAPGGYVFETTLHELGHALGLKHPFEGASLPAEFDNTRYTVMSYADFADSRLRYFYEEAGEFKTATFFVQPLTPMLLDVIAIQGLYGAATDIRPDDTVYSMDEEMSYLLTLVDSGGIDTLNLITHDFPSAINLTAGQFSSIAYYSIADQIKSWTERFPDKAAMIAEVLNRPGGYTWSNNLAIDVNTTIENVRAGAGDDTINGNAVGNDISGNAGSDRIFGAAGNDTLDGGSAGAAGNYLRGDEGDDSLTGGGDFDDINGNMGNDTVSTGGGDDYCVGGRDNDVLFGGDGGDFVYGNLGDDSCDGGAGNDTVRGGQGTDTLSGGAGNDFLSGDRGDDTMTGGAGADIFHSSGDAGIDRVLDFSLADGDRVLLDPGTVFTVSQVGGDTVIQMSAGQVVLVGVSMSALPPGTIFGA